jgi:hypothetical protein
MDDYSRLPEDKAGEDTETSRQLESIPAATRETEAMKIRFKLT